MGWVNGSFAGWIFIKGRENFMRNDFEHLPFSNAKGNIPEVLKIADQN